MSNAFLESFRQVFKKSSYIILTIVVAGLVLLFSIWLRNRELLNYIFISDLFSWGAKLKFLWNSLVAFNINNVTVVSHALIIFLAILSGINISFLIFYLKNKAKVLKIAGVSGLGLIIGFLGIGCGACGSIILSSIFGLTFAAGFVSMLPFKGLEFGLLSVVILIISIYLLAKKISQPKVC